MLKAEFKMLFRAGIILVWAGIAFGTSRAQQGPLENSLPKNYVGEFRWDGDPVIQTVEIGGLTVGRVDASRIQALGCGRYTVPPQVTSISIRMMIDERSLGIEIWEGEANQSNFTTDGSHKGKITSDLQVIEAEWVTRESGKKGKLQLRAGGNLTCSSNI